MKASPIPSIVLCLLALSSLAAAQPIAVEETTGEAEAYLEFRRWISAQPEEIGEGEVLTAYRAHLAEQGMGRDEIEQRIAWLKEGREREEVELWNRVLTAENPRFNTEPNAFLVRMIEGREPGRALDVGMGQGRNAIWLAREGWKVTGFD